MKRLTALLAGAVLAAFAARAAPAAEIRLGIQNNTFNAAVLVAKQKGWIEEELAKAGAAGTTVQWIPFTSGPPLNEAFAAGKIDIAFLGDTPALIGRSVGLEAHIIANASSGPVSHALLVRGDSPVTQVAELKGKKVATFKGTSAHHLLLEALAEAKLSAGDIEFVNLPLADAVTALVKGDVAAALVWEPQVTRLETEHGARVLRDGTGLKNFLLVIEAADAFTAKHPTETRGLLRAFRRGGEFVHQNPDAAAELLAKDIAVPVGIIRRSLDRFDFTVGLRPSDVATVKKTEAFIRGQGLIRTPVDVDAFFDHSFAGEAIN